MKTVEGDTQTSLSCGIEAEGNEQIKLSDLLNSKIVQTKSGAFTATVMTPAGPMIMVRDLQEKKCASSLSTEITRWSPMNAIMAAGPSATVRLVRCFQ
ncbi:hypothetical protein HQ394_18295 [Defluviicoccus vanus]|uniref:Uncharacterized protein n=1 Tax=Defluviicoccus vanus TaxID=111831 RepID=A0A7H1N5B9_9PROT|nr:hypothetical protein HQ394_18295 [Defluviicoccus vanus]